MKFEKRVNETRGSSRVPAEAGTRSAVPWGVVGLACGMVEPEICVITV